MIASHAIPAYVPEARGPITHEVLWDFDSWDLDGPTVETGKLSAPSLDVAQDLERLCKADPFKRNVRIVPRVSPVVAVMALLLLSCGPKPGPVPERSRWVGGER